MFSIGTPGTPWGEAERFQWRSGQRRKRSYHDEVVRRLLGRADVVQYGDLLYGGEHFPLLAVRSRTWSDDVACALVTGGVHGYETSGVMGALQYIASHAAELEGRLNLIVAPCVSPWAYERIHRWNADAVDPNRSFFEGSKAQEAAALMRLVAPHRGRFLVHIDLHETTDSDETEFRPALAARDGKAYEPGIIPDGFYLVGDAEKPEPEFQKAIIAAVERVTHIAPADANGAIIGAPITSRGVINYEVQKLGLCAGVTRARFTTTTEVYPDSSSATPEQCNAAQIAAVRAALEFALRHERG